MHKSKEALGLAESGGKAFISPGDVTFMNGAIKNANRV